MIAPVSCCDPMTQYGYRGIGGDVIDLGDWDLVIAVPGLSAVERDRRALIEAEEHPLAVGRIDPDLVRVLTAGCALEGAERLAAVGRSIHGGADRVESVRIL